MRAATSAGCDNGMRQQGWQMTLPTDKGAVLMVATIDVGCCDWGDSKMVRLLMEEKAAGCSDRGEGGGSVQQQGHLRFRRGGEEDDGQRLGREAAVERSSTSTVRERGERPPMERKETNLPIMCSGSAGQLLRKERATAEEDAGEAIAATAGAIDSDGCGRGKKKQRRLMLLLQHLSLLL
ncbi:hypothetical protein BHM03_00052159 [Ensete ventricosum]|nr:hypothetical protein BHM03_00052159 [Ensete ventricosum]